MLKNYTQPMKSNLLQQKPLNKLSSYDKYIIASANLACANYNSLSKLTRKNYVDKSLALLSSIDIKNNKWRRLTAKCYLLKADLQYLLNKPIKALNSYKKLELVLTKNRNNNTEVEKTLLALSYIGMAESLVKIEENNIYPNHNQYLAYISKAIINLNALKTLTQELTHILSSTYKSLAIILFSSGHILEAIEIIHLHFNYICAEKEDDFLEISNQLDLLEVFNSKNYIIPQEYNPYFTLLELFDEHILFINNYLDYSFGSISELLVFCLKSKCVLYSPDTIHDIVNYTLYAIKYRKKLPNQHSMMIKEFNDPSSYKELTQLTIDVIGKFCLKRTSSSIYSNIIFRINQTTSYKQLLKKSNQRHTASVYNIAQYQRLEIN